MASRHTTIASPLGPLTLVADGDFLKGIFFEGHWHMPQKEFFGRVADPGDGLFTVVESQLDGYLRGIRTSFDIPYQARGGGFQQRVWNRLEQIPYASTVTYGQLAAELGGPGMAQAVGSAVGRNPLSIVIPCHRVVGHDGRLTGYAGGLANKRMLLELEAPSVAREARLF